MRHHITGITCTLHLQSLPPSLVFTPPRLHTHTGEWLVERAGKDEGVAAWVGVEVRHDRAYATYLRATLSRRPVVVLRGDATRVLAELVPPASVAKIVMSFPEPHGVCVCVCVCVCSHIYLSVAAMDFELELAHIYGNLIRM